MKEHSAQTYIPRLEGLDLVEYRRRVESVLHDHFKEHEVLKSIRAGKAVRVEQATSTPVGVLEGMDPLEAMVRIRDNL